MNDYQKAQFTLSGGGTVTWNKGRLKWTQRFIAISIEKGSTFKDGYMDIAMPTQDIAKKNVYDDKPRSVDKDNGIELKGWEALYASHKSGGGYTEVELHIVEYTRSFEAPSNWILVAVRNDDDKTVKLGTGVIISDKSSSSYGCSLPVGTIVMWSGDPEKLPDGWKLCDGQDGRPNLLGKFIVGYDKKDPDYNAVNKTGGEKTHTLTVAEMPSHTHNGTIMDADPKFTLPRGAGLGDQTCLAAATANWAGHVQSVKHSHELQIGPAGGGSPHENRPPYYVLAFIIKV